MTRPARKREAPATALPLRRPIAGALHCWRHRWPVELRLSRETTIRVTPPENDNAWQWSRKLLTQSPLVTAASLLGFDPRPSYATMRRYFEEAGR